LFDIERVMNLFRDYLEDVTDIRGWTFTPDNTSYFDYTARTKYVSVGIPAWGGSYAAIRVSVRFPYRWYTEKWNEIHQDIGVLDDVEAEVKLWHNRNNVVFETRVPFKDFRNPRSSRLIRALVEAIRELVQIEDQADADRTLRASLIRLAHANPGIRSTLLPLLRTCSGGTGT